MSDLTTPDRAYEGVQLAALNRPVLMLDMPGHGLSTPHSARQSYDLCFRRNSDSQAAPLVDAVGKLMHPDYEADCFGISHGAYLSMKLAELDPGDRFGTVFGIDLPAVKDRLTLGLQLKYMISDNLIGRKQYLKALEGTVYEQDFINFSERYEYGAPEPAQKFTAKNTGLFVTNLFFSVNARSGALKSWQNIMNQKTANVSVVTSENGGVSNPKAIQKFIESLPEDQRIRSSQVVIEGEDHNIGIVHLMPRAVEWAGYAYE